MGKRFISIREAKKSKLIILTVMFIAMLINIMAYTVKADTSVPFSSIPDGAIYTPDPNGASLGTGGVFVQDSSGFAVVHDDFISGKYKTKEVDPYIERALTAIGQEMRRNNKSLTEEQEYALYNELQDYFKNSIILTKFLTEGMGADFVTARRVMSGLQKPVQIATGILVWGCLLFFGFVTISDIMYITIPVLHAGIVGDEKGGRKPILVSIEAYNAVKSGLTMVSQGHYNDKRSSNKTVNTLWEYTKSRVVYIVVFVLSITLVASGRLMSLVVSGTTSLLQGVLDLLGL